VSVDNQLQRASSAASRFRREDEWGAIVVSLDGAIVTEVQLTKPVTVVGRHPTCDIRIDHPAVSGRHMLFRSVNRTMYAEDLASTNGMKVNGLATQHQVVHHLDMIEVGTHRLHFFDEGPAGPERPRQPRGHRAYRLRAHDDGRARGASGVPPRRRSPSRRGRIFRAPWRSSATRRSGSDRAAPPSPRKSSRWRCAWSRASAAARTIDLRQANTILGTIGGDSALVVKRNNGYFVVRFGRQSAPAGSTTAR
jgi:hypothetical protein